MSYKVLEEKVIKKNYCVGCGICVGICPKKAIVMKFNPYGEYSVFKTENPCNNCGLCLKICPFFFKNPEEIAISETIFSSLPGISYQKETGFYLNFYVGYSSIDDHRINGASGGLATWFLEKLLSIGEVDYVVCVSLCKENEKIFKYTIQNDIKKIRECAGSVYYPVEMSEVLSEILRKPAKYVIIGLPCFVKSLRLAQNNHPTLKTRIKFIAGLVCGQMKNKFFTKYLVSLAGAQSENIAKIKFRGKEPETPANNFFFEVITSNGYKGKIYWKNGMDRIWINRWFTLLSCNFCKDVFAECADIVFMDAWLPEYEKNWYGTSIVLVRNNFLNSLLQSSNGKEICISNITLEKVIKSQEKVIQIKKYILPLLYGSCKHIQIKGFLQRIKYFILLKEMKIFINMQKESREKIIYCLKNGLIDTKKFLEFMKPYIRKVNLFRIIKSFIYFPIKLKEYFTKNIIRKQNGQF